MPALPSLFEISVRLDFLRQFLGCLYSLFRSILQVWHRFPSFVSQQFMKFVKKIGDGDITIKDNEVIDASVDDKAVSWADEFATSSNQNQVLVCCVLDKSSIPFYGL